MKNDIASLRKQSGFSIYIDLFDKGEFNEMHIIPSNKKFSVILDDTELVIISKNENNFWFKIRGNMPPKKLEQIGNMINLKING